MRSIDSLSSLVDPAAGVSEDDFLHAISDDFYINVRFKSKYFSHIMVAVCMVAQMLYKLLHPFGVVSVAVQNKTTGLYVARFNSGNKKLPYWYDNNWNGPSDLDSNAERVKEIRKSAEFIISKMNNETLHHAEPF